MPSSVEQLGISKSADQTFYFDFRADWKRSFGDHNLQNIHEIGLDCVVCIGGNGTQKTAAKFAAMVYNIFMMEECHTVLAAGAGAVTKLKAPHGDRIERIFNYKYPYEYNERFEQLMQRKERIKQFYASYK